MNPPGNVSERTAGAIPGRIHKVTSQGIPLVTAGEILEENLE